MTVDVNFETFEKQIGSAVNLSVGDQKLPAKIIEVMKMTKHGDAERDPFSVLIVTDSSDHYEQQLFKFDHAELGKFDLFMVPIGPKENGMCYEAVFT